MPPSSTFSSSSKVHHVLKDRPFEPDTLMEIVHILNGANIPSILWGNSLLDIYGVPTIDFVCLSFASKILVPILIM